MVQTSAIFISLPLLWHVDLTKKIAEYYLRYPVAIIILLLAVVAWIGSGLLVALVLVTALRVILYAGTRPLLNAIELFQEYFLSLLEKL